ncbi:MAG: hypothetical protein QW734_09380 [Candidatus Bathyarchaeia archaeon]
MFIFEGWVKHTSKEREEWKRKSNEDHTEEKKEEWRGATYADYMEFKWEEWKRGLYAHLRKLFDVLEVIGMPREEAAEVSESVIEEIRELLDPLDRSIKVMIEEAEIELETE